jgi:colanic acid/amylovoran biosynthesis glycosyltransferase
MDGMALGRTVISSCITGVAELVKHRENGWLITCGCVGEIAAAMHETLDTSIDHLNEMASAGF